MSVRPMLAGVATSWAEASSGGSRRGPATGAATGVVGRRAPVAGFGSGLTTRIVPVKVGRLFVTAAEPSKTRLASSRGESTDRRKGRPVAAWNGPLDSEKPSVWPLASTVPVPAKGPCSERADRRASSAVRLCTRPVMPFSREIEPSRISTSSRTICGLGRQRRPGADERQPALLRQRNADMRAVELHREDLDDAREVGRQLRVHAKAGGRHQRLVRIGRVLDDDIGEGHRGKGKDSRGSRAAHDHLVPDDRRGLPLEIGAIGAPVDEIRGDQHAEQREDQQSADGDEASDQDTLLLVRPLSDICGRAAAATPAHLAPATLAWSKRQADPSASF